MEHDSQSCEIEIRVKYAEVDQMGVVHHSRYWIYFETGRTELLRRQGVPYKECEARGVFFVVAKCSAKYHAPGRYDELLLLTTRVKKIGPARIDHTYELKRKSDGQILATAETTLACVDRGGEVVPIPAFIQKAHQA